MPPLPASPLAGGQPAARGDAFIDAHGQPIVLPAGYCDSCPGDYGPGFCGDPMAIDFGGCGQDQCGPHYFDVSYGTVFLQGEDFFEGTLPFTSAGVAGPKYLDAETEFGEYEPGWEIAVRYDIGPLAVLEATYMGVYDISMFSSVNSPDVTPGNHNLFGVFSNYGTGTLIPGIDDGQTHSINYQADLQSTEISYRRYWVGNRSSVSGTMLLGFRYFRFTDDFAFDSVAVVNTNPNETANLLWSGENDLVGFQFGGDGWVCLRQGLRVGCEGTMGLYNNRYKFAKSGDFSDAGTSDFASSEEGNQIAFATEGEVSIVADILPSWSIRGGYRVMYLNSLVTAENNLDQTNLQSTTVLTQAGLLFHGFHGGVEYVW